MTETLRSDKPVFIKTTGEYDADGNWNAVKTEVRGFTLWLIDSRSRSVSGKRILRRYPDNAAGEEAAWRVMLEAEQVDPADWGNVWSKDQIGSGYLGFVVNEHAIDRDDEEPWSPRGTSFNAFWAEYGWYMMLVDDDMDVPEDCLIA